MRGTLLTRIGNKTRISHHITKHFPEHKNYVEMFFGAGGMFFNKKKSLHSVCNDLDNDVYNLFNVVRHDRDKLVDTLIKTPIHQTLFKKWCKTEEEDPIWKAVRFLVLSNFSFLGKGDLLRFSNENTKKILLSKIDDTFIEIQNVLFMNVDFRKVIPQLSFRNDRPNERLSTFIYADPPYLETTSNYAVPKWTEKDSEDLINICKETDLKMAISEFDNPKILEMTNGLNITNITERNNLKNRRNEILITNYDSRILSQGCLLL